MTCEHNNNREISRLTLDLGVSGTITWVRRQCDDCGKVTVDRIVAEAPQQGPPPFQKKEKKKQKIRKNLE